MQESEILSEVQALFARLEAGEVLEQSREQIKRVAVDNTEATSTTVTSILFDSVSDKFLSRHVTTDFEGQTLSRDVLIPSEAAFHLLRTIAMDKIRSAQPQESSAKQAFLTLVSAQQGALAEEAAYRQAVADRAASDNAAARAATLLAEKAKNLAEAKKPQGGN